MDFEKVSLCLRDASKNDDLTSFNEILKSVPDHKQYLLNLHHEKSGDTIIHLACSLNLINILKFINETYNMNILLIKENFDSKTPLHVAVQYCSVSCVEYLLSCNVPVDALKRGDWTPLMLSCTKRNVKITNVLLKANANPHLINKDGWNALHIACREGFVDNVIALINHDASLLNTRSKNGRTPLHTAALHGQIAIVDILLVHGNYIADDKDSCGTTPLMDAATANNVPIMKLLTEKQKASPYVVDLLGRNVLHLAAQAGSIDAINYLVTNYNLSTKSKCHYGKTPLDFAKKENKFAALDALKLLDDGKT